MRKTAGSTGLRCQLSKSGGWLVVSASIILLALILLPGALIRQILLSDHMRQPAEAALANSLGIHGRFTEFTRSGRALLSSRFEGMVGDASLIAEDIRAEPGLVGWPGGTLHLDNLTIRKAGLILAEPLPSHQAGMPSLTAPPSGTTPLPIWLKLLLPSAFEMSPATIESGDLEMQGRFALRGARASIAPEGSGIRIHATNAKLESPLPGAWRLDSLDLLQIGAESRLVSSTFQLEGCDATATATGNWLPNSHANAHVILRRLPINTLFPSLAGSLHGSLDADVRIQLAGAARSTWSLAGDVQGHGTRLTNFPALDALAQISGNSLVRTLDFQEARAHVAVAEGIIKAKDLAIESRGNLRLEGILTLLPDKSLNGSIELGMSPHLLDNIPGAKSIVFTTRRGQYLWTPVRISGTLDAPKTDLPARLAAALPAGLLLDSTSTATNAVKTTEQAAEAAAHEANSLLNEAGRAIQDFFRPW